MKAILRKELNYFPKALDSAVNDKFGAETMCKSEYNFLDDRYVSQFKGSGKNKELIESFIEGWLVGNVELGDRLRRADETNKCQS